jgi:hypothetical protein
MDWDWPEKLRSNVYQTSSQSEATGSRDIVRVEKIKEHACSQTYGYLGLS